MRKNNFLKYGKVFLSSVLISTYSSVAIPANGGYFQGDNQTTTSFFIKSDVPSIENKLKSIGYNKDNIKNNLKVYSKDAVTMQSIDEKKNSGETFTTIKKVKTIPQKIFKAIKYLASSVALGIGYIIKNKFFDKKPQRKFAKIDDEQPKHDQKIEQTDVNSPFKNHSSFINYKPDDDDDDGDESKPPKFYPARPKTPDKPFTSDEDDETETPEESKSSDDDENKINNLPPAISANNNLRRPSNNLFIAGRRRLPNLSAIPEASEEEEEDKEERNNNESINCYISGINNIGERDPRVNSMNIRLLAHSDILNQSEIELNENSVDKSMNENKESTNTTENNEQTTNVNNNLNAQYNIINHYAKEEHVEKETPDDESAPTPETFRLLSEDN